MAERNQENRSTRSNSRAKSKFGRVTRSRNPFVLFLMDFKQQPESQNKSQPTIFKMAGERWRNMTESEKAPYLSAAKEAKDKEPRVKKPAKGQNKGGNATKITADKNKKKIKNRKCSQCGHKHGRPVRHRSTDSDSDKEGVAKGDEDGDAAETSVESSRSRSRSKSGSGSADEEEDFMSDSSATM